MNSHTVQRAYLNGFLLESSKNRVFDVFSKNTKRWRMKSPKSTTVEPDYYSFRSADGCLDNSIEHVLDRIVESPGIQALRKLAVGQTLSTPEHHAAALYIGCMLKRTKRIQALQEEADRRLSDPEFVKMYIRLNLARLTRKHSADEIDEFVRQLDTNERKVSLPDSWYLWALRSVEKYGATIASMNWIVETSRAPHWFITSDNPAFVCRPTRTYLPHTVGLLREDLGAELCMPLTTTSFFRASFCNIGTGRQRASPSRVRELNRRVAIHAVDEVVLPERTPSITTIVEEESDTKVLPIDPQWILESGNN